MSATVCWFIQSHRDPEQILRLVRTLRRGSRGPIVLQHNPRGCELDPGSFGALPDVHLLTASAPQLRATSPARSSPIST